MTRSIPLALGLTFLWMSTAEAVENRLRVVNLTESAFTSFARSSPGDQKPAPDLERLISAVDGGSLPPAVLLYDRNPRPAAALEAQPFGGVAVTPRQDDRGQWMEFVWDGQPGQRTVFLLNIVGRQLQELRRVAVRGGGGVFHLRPDGVGLRPRPSRAAGFPLELVRAWEGRDGLWQRWIAPHVDLRDGIAIIRGVDSVFPDQAYIAIEQAQTPRVFTVILAWGYRDAISPSDAEGAGVGPSAPTAGGGGM